MVTVTSQTKSSVNYVMIEFGNNMNPIGKYLRNFPFAHLIGIDLHIVFMNVRCILEYLVLLDSCCEKPVFLF